MLYFVNGVLMMKQIIFLCTINFQQYVGLEDKRLNYLQLQLEHVLFLVFRNLLLKN